MRENPDNFSEKEKSKASEESERVRSREQEKIVVFFWESEQNTEHVFFWSVRNILWKWDLLIHNL